MHFAVQHSSMTTVFTFARHDVCFLRLPLYPAIVPENGLPVLARGTKGIVREYRSSDNTVKVLFDGMGDIRVRCNPKWLEKPPGEISRGLNAREIEDKHWPFYRWGMLVTDLTFPTEDQPCFQRFRQHRDTLLGNGFSFCNGVEATLARDRLKDYCKDVGLVLCEEIWPWKRRRYPIVAQFHAGIAHALLQWPKVTSVMVLRQTNADAMQRVLGPINRISYFTGADMFKLHYTPLNMDGADPPTPVRGQVWTAIVIQPVDSRDRFVASGFNTNRYYEPLSIPHLVLRAMLRKKRTLQLCAYTLESAMAIQEYLEQIKKMYKLKPECTDLDVLD